MKIPPDIKPAAEKPTPLLGGRPPAFFFVNPLLHYRECLVEAAARDKRLTRDFVAGVMSVLPSHLDRVDAKVFAIHSSCCSEQNSA